VQTFIRADMTDNGFIKIPRSFYQCEYYRKLSSAERSIYAAICSQADYKTRVCTSSSRRIADEAGVEHAWVLRAKRKLNSIGIFCIKTNTILFPEDLVVTQSPENDEKVVTQSPEVVTQSPKVVTQSPALVTQSPDTLYKKYKNKEYKECIHQNTNTPSLSIEKKSGRINKTKKSKSSTRTKQLQLGDEITIPTGAWGLATYFRKTIIEKYPNHTCSNGMWSRKRWAKDLQRIQEQGLGCKFSYEQIAVIVRFVFEGDLYFTTKDGEEITWARLCDSPQKLFKHWDKIYSLFDDIAECKYNPSYYDPNKEKFPR
jgi:hypothetical protein